MVLSENDIEVITKIITTTFATLERKGGGEAIHGKHLRIDQFVGNTDKWDGWSFVYGCLQSHDHMGKVRGRT